MISTESFQKSPETERKSLHLNDQPKKKKLLLLNRTIGNKNSELDYYIKVSRSKRIEEQKSVKEAM